MEGRGRGMEWIKKEWNDVKVAENGLETGAGRTGLVQYGGGEEAFQKQESE